MASRKQRVAALGQFQASAAFRQATSIRYDHSPTRKERAAALKAWKEADELRALTAGDGLQVGIAVDMVQVENLLDKLAELAPDVVEELDRIGRRVAFNLEDDIRADWPVDTGFSLSQWDTQQLGEGVYAVLNLAIYSGLVQRSGSSETVAAEIMRGPAESAQREYAKLAADAIRKVTDS